MNHGVLYDVFLSPTPNLWDLVPLALLVVLMVAYRRNPRRRQLLLRLLLLCVVMNLVFLAGWFAGRAS